MNAAKRRRLNESSSTLSKPFRSPMLKKKPATDDNAAQSTTLTTALSTDQPDSSSPSRDPSPPRLPSSPGPPSLSKPTSRARASLSSPTRPRQRPSILTKDQDPVYLALQKEHSALLQQLSKFRTSLDISQQAVKITASTTDAELQTLITKWRAASREAAEELFCSARDRVNQMGGVGAWRERTKKQSGGWADENEDQSELTEAQKEARTIMLEDMQAEMQRYGGKKEEEVIEEKDDESFTMDMMLKQLSVELDVIGYDKASQRWI